MGQFDFHLQANCVSENISTIQVYTSLLQFWQVREYMASIVQLNLTSIKQIFVGLHVLCIENLQWTVWRGTLTLKINAVELQYNIIEFIEKRLRVRPVKKLLVLRVSSNELMLILEAWQCITFRPPALNFNSIRPPPSFGLSYDGCIIQTAQQVKRRSAYITVQYKVLSMRQKHFRKYILASIRNEIGPAIDCNGPCCLLLRQ